MRTPSASGDMHSKDIRCAHDAAYYLTRRPAPPGTNGTNRRPPPPTAGARTFFHAMRAICAAAPFHPPCDATSVERARALCGVMPTRNRAAGKESSSRAQWLCKRAIPRSQEEARGADVQAAKRSFELSDGAALFAPAHAAMPTIFCPRH